MRAFVSTLAAVMVACVAALSAPAAETVWSGLVMASNAPEPTPIPAELGRLEGTLKQLFGYNQFQVIGSSRKTLQSGEEEWLAQSKYFSLRVESKAAAKAAYALKLQLFQEQNLLLETDARLTKSSPLVIRGPQVGEGQLVLLLVLE